MKYKRYQKKFDYSYTLGVYPTLELLKYRSNQVQHVVLTSQWASNTGALQIKDICQRNAIPCEVNDSFIQKFADKEDAHALAFFTKYESVVSSTENQVVLVNPSNTGNVGTIMRTMLGFNFMNLVIIRPAIDIFDPKVIRASMGAVFQLRVSSYDSFTVYAKENTFPKYLFMLAESNNFEAIPYKTPFALVFGNEGAGLPTDLKQFGTPVKISQSDKIDSLNLAISTGIALYRVSQLLAC